MLFAIFLGFALLPSLVWSQPQIAVLPFENLSGIRAASGKTMPSIDKVLIEKGYKLLPREVLERFLREERIRFLDSLPSPITQKLTSKFTLEGVLTGTILSYVSGENPQVGLSARLLSKDGNLFWGNTIGLTGEGQMGILGLGKVEKIEDLIPIATAELFETLNLKGGVNLKRLGGLNQFLLSGPRAYRSSLLNSKNIFRIGVLPFENKSTNKEAGRILLNLLILRLAARERFKVVETGDVREGMISEGIQSFEEIDLNQLKILGRKLGTNFFIRGTIFKYSEGLGAVGLTSPEIELYLSMLDAETGKVLWTAHHSRKGENYLTVLQFGLIRNPIALSDQVLEEMVKTLTKSPDIQPKVSYDSLEFQRGY